MKELQELMLHVIQDAAQLCSTTMDRRDIARISERCSHEGLSFLTITLPNFLDDVMSSIEEGKVTSDRFVGWRKRLCLPAFLMGFTSLVFDPKTGEMYENPNPLSVLGLRQICSLAKKIKLDCKVVRRQKALDDYSVCDDELRDAPVRVSEESWKLFRNVSRILWGEVFGGMVEAESLIPHHGPGSTQEGIQGNKKYAQGDFSWPRRLAVDFDPSCCLFNSEESHFHSGVDVPLLEVSEELPVRVTSVLKTQKAPRIIALEPVAMQMAQQSVKDYVVNRLESNSLTAGHINFTDQSVNRKLAFESSISRRFATLDLSAASDRVHKDFVWHMLSVNPTLRRLFFCTRSACAQLPDARVIFLNKFASMGSALCFPAEAMFFATLSVAALVRRRSLSPSVASIRRCMNEVFVYGDDIIVPTHEVEAVVTMLQEFGNVVSKKKSFTKGFFRESCGMDAFKGVDVTPVYLRNPIPNSMDSTNAIISCVETANLLAIRGLYSAASYLRSRIEAITGNLPVLNKDSEGLGWWADGFAEKECKVRFNKRLQRLEVRTLVPKASLKNDVIDGYAALHKCLLFMTLPDKGRRSPWQTRRDVLHAQQERAVDHLCRSSRRGVVTLKRRWVQAA
jgi:hypothetical protein